MSPPSSVLRWPQSSIIVLHPLSASSILLLCQSSVMSPASSVLRWPQSSIICPPSSLRVHHPSHSSALRHVSCILCLPLASVLNHLSSVLCPRPPSFSFVSPSSCLLHRLSSSGLSPQSSALHPLSAVPHPLTSVFHHPVLRAVCSIL